MKCILALVALTLLSITSVAQQTGSNKLPDVDFHCDADAWAGFRDLCRHEEKQSKQAQLKFEASEAERIKHAIETANELKKAADDAKNLRSNNTNEQITGATDTAKDINSHANNNAASRVVTDKALGVIDGVAQRENESLNDTGNTIQSGLQTQAGSTTPYSAGGHVLNESTRANADAGAQPSTIDQLYEQQEQMLMPAPSARSAAAESEPTKRSVGSQVSVNELLNNQENSILLSPSNVAVVADAYRRILAAEQARLAIEAKEKAEHDKQIAEEKRIAKIENEKEQAAAEAKEAAAEAAEDAAEAKEYRAYLRQVQAARNAMFAYYPAQNGLGSYPPGQYFPSALPQDSSGYANPYIDGLPKGSGTIGSGYTHPDIAPCLSIVGFSAEISCIMHAPDVDSTGQVVSPAAQQPPSQNGNVPSAPAQSSPAQATPTTAH